MPAERLQKLLARAGIASRRAAEALILDGRVRVDGRVVRELGTKADPREARVEIDGRVLLPEKRVYYLLHKPRAVVSTLDDPEGRRTVGELMRHVPERVYPVGRLDFHTTGALLLTNDGALTNALLHPSKGVPRTYLVKVSGEVSPDSVEALRRGLPIGPGERARATDVTSLRRQSSSTWLRVTLTEGRNRQIHRMFEAIGHRVSRLARTAFAGITVDDLRPGDYRPLKADEVRRLKKYLPESPRTGGSRGSPRNEAESPGSVGRPRRPPASRRPHKRRRP